MKKAKMPKLTKIALQLINQSAKELKELILVFVQEIIEPYFWEELTASLEQNGSGNYHILDDDLPIMRDLKAFLNILTALERATEKLTDRYALMAVSLVKKMEIIQDYIDAQRNYEIISSTNSILTYYLKYLKDITLTTIFPILIEKITELRKLFTMANLEKSTDFFIEKTILLETYQEHYVQKKLSAQNEVASDKIEEKNDDFISLIIKQNDEFLKKIYKDKYDSYFKSEVKPELKSENKLDNIENFNDYYPDNKKDNETVKNVKLLLNGIKVIKKLVDDYAGYQKAGVLSRAAWMATFLMHLKEVYDKFQAFDYEAIIAENARPFTEKIKNLLKQLNDMLEDLACIADQFENEFRLKEGALLKHVKLLIDRHNQITCELRIPTDYVKQNYIYYKSRLLAREYYLTEIDTQIIELQKFMQFKDYALMDIPYYIIQAMQSYIKKYDDDICMNHDRLATYKKYLSDALDIKRGFKAFVMGQFEYIANRCGLTIHYELMKTLNDRMLYLQRQKIFLNERCERSKKYLKDNPYHYFKLSDITKLGQQAAILKALKTRANELNSEKDKLLEKTGIKKNIPSDQKSKPGEEKAKPVEEKVKSEIVKLEAIRSRLANQIKLKTKEFGIFSLAMKKYEETYVFEQPIDMLKKEDGLTPNSMILLQEISEVLSTPEEKIAKLTAPR